jgi:hypothetical protein
MPIRTAKIVLGILILIVGIFILTVEPAVADNPAVQQVAGIESPLGPVMVYKIRVSQTGQPQFVYVAISGKDVNASITAFRPTE